MVEGLVEDIAAMFETYVENVFDYFIPTAVITVGCIGISVKLVINREKRRYMSSFRKTQKSSVVKMETLLMISLRIFIRLLSLIAWYIFPSYFLDMDTILFILSLALGKVLPTFIYLNSAGTFLIYIAFNKKFRITFLNLLRILSC